MFSFLLWLLLIFLCWPLALLALILYPFFWLLSIPFKIFGYAVEGILKFVKSLFMLPSRVLGGSK